MWVCGDGEGRGGRIREVAWREWEDDTLRVGGFEDRGMVGFERGTWLWGFGIFGVDGVGFIFGLKVW